jgi:hypothetical protein
VTRGELPNLEGNSIPLLGYVTATIDPPNDPATLRNRSRSRTAYSYRPNDTMTSGVNHATKPGDAHTACGLETEGMYLFPELPFSDRALACGSCLAALRRA